ncbi:MAG: IS110 family transposase [Methylocella sp.]
MHGERAMKQSTMTYVAMDTHKNTISVAIAESGRGGEVRFIGEIPSRPESVAKMVEHLAAKHGTLAFCYEAGPCGYGLHRQVTMLGRSWPKVPAGEACWNGQRRDECVVVAPSLVPTRPGDHVKTGRRDATTLASLFRSGELTPVWVPDDAHEAMRDLCRARQATMEALRRARQQVLSFLLRHGRIYSGGGHWTRKHRLWLAAQRFDHPARQIAFEELVQAVGEAQARRDRLAKQMQELVPAWSLARVVTAIQALRGVAFIAAITLVAEIGDFHRFANPRQLMAYLGLTPSERSSGAKTLRGVITKAGNTRARRVLIEGAWTYRLPARIGAKILEPNESLPQPIKDIAWKAQVRLCARHRRLARAGKPANVVNVAIARELAAFVWAIATNEHVGLV